VPKKAASSIRFMNDGSMRTEEGWHLFAGRPLSPEAARDAARTLRIVIHHFGKPTEDISGDTRRIVPALNDVTEFYELFKYNAFIYSGDGDHKVLVLRWNH